MIGKLALVVAVMVPSSQLSVAVGVVRSAIAATGHSPVSTGKFDISGIGASVSPMVTCCVCVEVLPASSSYVQVRVVLVVIGGVVAVVAVMVPSQLSVAVGAVREVICEQSSSIGKPELSGMGAVLSPMVTSCVCVAVLFAASV